MELQPDDIILKKSKSPLKIKDSSFLKIKDYSKERILDAML